MAAIKWIHRVLYTYCEDGARSRSRTASQLPLLCMALHGWEIRRHFQKRITQMLICFSSTRMHSAALSQPRRWISSFLVLMSANSSAIY